MHKVHAVKRMAALMRMLWISHQVRFNTGYFEVKGRVRQGKCKGGSQEGVGWKRLRGRRVGREEARWSRMGKWQDMLGKR